MLVTNCFTCIQNKKYMLVLSYTFSILNRNLQNRILNIHIFGFVQESFIPNSPLKVITEIRRLVPRSKVKLIENI